MTRLRVINLGLPKSGTTTLGRSLREAGLRVADWKVRPDQSDDPEVGGRFLGDLMYRGYFETGDPLQYLDGFDALSELNVANVALNRWPQTDWGLLSALMERHPGARFLLSSREAGRHVDSILRWNNLGRERLPRLDIPGLPRGFGTSAEELARWIEGHRSFCRKVFAGSDRFLEYDVEDPGVIGQLSDFLGIELTWWGTENRNPQDKATGAVR
ncbi:hypothetical protein SAMN05444007_101385 [Cribrihabitans marinus]|uniref:Sulfotransferase family protein n=1 Tax=Cribrihabitans marinus TaxID=1227549 RepID=A0A1H6R6V6_9RHOB|nr:sulfotransferase family protein [Cribrihabitans marinus]GGH20373.1 hypothetical protein GCM10010973_04270 [Cribrihabitans marinus]SEI50206.1 hypothetical protein SAMN05444007_101385 [Cribrihabitans marinus]